MYIRVKVAHMCKLCICVKHCFVREPERVEALSVICFSHGSGALTRVGM